MIKLLVITLAFICILLSGCENNQSIGIIGGADEPTTIFVDEEGEKSLYAQISAEEAKEIMDSDENIIILDVREQDEYDSGHIPGAILIPYTEIDEKADEILPDKNKKILVYCRSGRRSKIASEKLIELGFRNVKEFGGIIDWPFEIEK